MASKQRNCKSPKGVWLKRRLPDTVASPDWAPVWAYLTLRMEFKGITLTGNEGRKIISPDKSQTQTDPHTNLTTVV